MKKHIYDLLDQVTPANDEHKDVLRSFLAFPVIVFAIIGALYSLLIFMR
jgi:hypothetical protein